MAATTSPQLGKENIRLRFKKRQKKLSGWSVVQRLTLFMVFVFRRLAIVAIFLFGTIGHSQVIGMVVSAQGIWCDQAHQQCDARNFQDLWKLYPVSKDSKLVRVGKTTGQESVVIRSRWGKLETFDCSNPRELGCKQPLDLARLIPEVPETNVVTAFFDALLQLAADRPKMYDSIRQGILQTRGGQWQSLSDGVAELGKGGLNLNSVFDNWAAGKYLVELCPLDDSASPKCSDDIKPVSYSWDPRKPEPLPVNDFRPGLYRLYISETSLGLPVRTSNYADLVAAEAPLAEQLDNDFLRVRNATQSWDTTDGTAAALRRAYLYSLAYR